MVEYNPSFLQQFAQKLDHRANWTVAFWVILGLLIGAGLKFEAALFGANASGVAVSSSPDFLVMCLSAVVGGIFGYLVGANRAVMLKLQAQTVLCQLQIEINTRRPGIVPPPPPSAP